MDDVLCDLVHLVGNYDIDIDRAKLAVNGINIHMWKE